MGGVLLVFFYMLCQLIIFPYIAIIKVEQGKLKMTCAYVVGEKKSKGSARTIISIGDDEYQDIDIIPTKNGSLIKKGVWNQFPIRNKRKEFSKIEPSVCKQVQYVEVYKILDFEKIYLYDYISDF